MARNLRFNHTIEHRFVFAEGEEPQVVSGDAFAATEAVDVPDTDLKAQVWRIQRGAELSIHDREADKLSKLQDADGIAYATDGDIAELPVLVAPDPTDPVDRTPRAEVERAAQDAGHTPEGAIHDVEAHRAYAKRNDFAPGGPAADTAVAPTPRPAAAPRPGVTAAGRSSPPPSPAGPAGAPQTTRPPASAAGASAQPLPPGAAAPQATGPAPARNTGVAGAFQGGQAPTPGTAPPPGFGPGAPAGAANTPQPVNIRGTMQTGPSGPASAAPSAPQNQPR